MPTDAEAPLRLMLPLILLLVLASAGLHVVPMMLPPHLLYAQAYMGRK